MGRETEPGQWAVLCAMPEELGSLRERVVEVRRTAGLELLRLEGNHGPATACVCGVGKVRAAAGTAALLAEPTRGLFVVGVCGGLSRGMRPGTLVHCERAVQADLAVRSDREFEPDPELSRLWREQVEGLAGWFLTADRPVLTAWRKLRLRRAFARGAAAEMETAAAAAVASRAKVPWAALRAVTDVPGRLAPLSFQRNYTAQAGRAADTLPALWKHWTRN